MADLLAKQPRTLRLTRNQEVEGSIVAITDQEIILDLGTKSEGVLSKKSIPQDQQSKLKMGDRLVSFVLTPENESGQVVLGLQKSFAKVGAEKFQRFEEALAAHQTLLGRGVELNKGGLIVEVGGVRGFLPSSQVALSSVSNLEHLVGKEIQVGVIEVDTAQNRLIFSQKHTLSDNIKGKLNTLKVGDKVVGKVAAVLPFGIFIALEGDHQGLEGLVHVSEISWEKTEEPGILFKVGQELEVKVISLDMDSGRVNLSLRQLTEDPFKKIAEKYHSDDVVKGEVTKVTANSISVKLDDGVEAILPPSKVKEGSYSVGQKTSFLIDSVDAIKHKITLAPLVTSTKDLIYK